MGAHNGTLLLVPRFKMIIKHGKLDISIVLEKTKKISGEIEKEKREREREGEREGGKGI